MWMSEFISNDVTTNSERVNIRTVNTVDFIFVRNIMINHSKTLIILLQCLIIGNLKEKGWYRDTKFSTFFNTMI